VVGYSPLARGILSGKFNKDWAFKDGDDRSSNVLFLKEHFGRTLEGVDKIKQLAKNKNSSIASLSIKWTILQPGITSTLIGARNIYQLTENMKSLDTLLNDDDIGCLNEISKEVLGPIKEKGYPNPFNLKL
jgi:aryl-alcohol dehydrogenase-like predicted oxidoreductase